MGKRIDFAEQRRKQAHAQSIAVQKAIELISQQTGVDFQASLREASAQRREKRRLLAERLLASVVPIFVLRAGRPDRIGSCVFVRLGTNCFAFTAAHVVRDEDTSRLFVPLAETGGELIKLPTSALRVNEHDGLDTCVLLLRANVQDQFPQRTFLSSEAIDPTDQPDDCEPQCFYFAFGYPASRTQFKTTGKQIHQKAFQCSMDAVISGEYVQEKIEQAHHLLLGFDHKEILADGFKVTPPDLQGVSGGGIFRIYHAQMGGPLIAIATRHRRDKRLVVATRIKHFLTVARDLGSAVEM